MTKYVLLICFLFYQLPATDAQRKWKGGYSDAWSEPLNWDPVGVPAITDDVVLDNSSIMQDYQVVLPSTAVTVVSINIRPATEKNIRFILPSVNVSSPALTLTGTGDVLVIGAGGVFQNSSGLASGQSLQVGGLIKINNGGKYIHNTRSAHANDIVAKLSTAEGTESGVFEFDIPSASSTISLSNRSFGALKLSANAYQANVSYSGGGSNPVTVRSWLEIGDHVNFSIGFSNVFSIRGDLLQLGGTFNIANGNTATTIALGGHIIQKAGVITKTGSAVPLFLLNGSSTQQLSFAAGITGNVIIRVDNSAGALLRTHCSIPYKLELKNGKMKTADTALLIIQAGGLIESDSLSASYVNGPLRIEGLNGRAHCLFPVGNAFIHRWVALKEATGNFTVRYQQVNPYSYSSAIDTGLNHLSSLESWSIEADLQPAATAAVELSFDNVHSGGVSDVNTLRVAQFAEGNKWLNVGKAATTGTAGAAGSVTSIRINNFILRRLFTLASSVSEHNTLPADNSRFDARRKKDAIVFDWKLLAGDLPIAFIVLESGTDGKSFAPRKTIPMDKPYELFNFLYYPAPYENYFRMKMIPRDQQPLYSSVIYVKPEKQLHVMGQLNGTLNLNVDMERSERVIIMLHDITGKQLLQHEHALLRGTNQLQVPIATLKPGMYIVTLRYSNNKNTIFFKW